MKQLQFMFDNNPSVIPESTQIHFNDIGTAGNTIKIYCYLKEKDYVGFLKARQVLLSEILKVVEKENIDIAYPTQTILLKNTKEVLNIQEITEN